MNHEGTLWVADARVDISVDRAVLLDRDPLQALTDDSYVRRCRMLAGYRARAALSNELLAEHIRPLDAFVRGAAWRRKIKEAWVLCFPTPLNPAVVFVYLLADTEAKLDEIRGAVADWYWEHVKATTSTIRLRPPEVQLIATFVPNPSAIELEDFGRR